MAFRRLFGAAILAGAALSASGCEARISEAKAAPAPEKPVRVDVLVAEARTAPVFLSLSGTLEANRSSDVAADAAGKVSATFVERGAYVRRGAVLARLDGTSAGLSAAQAKADTDGARTELALAADELARTEKLHATGVLADVELTRARARKAAAEQRVAGSVARTALSAKTYADAAIRAPFDGLVADRFIDEGEYVRPDTRVVTLVDVESLRLKLFVPEAATTKIAAGQAVAFSVASDPSTLHFAKVQFVAPAIGAARELVAEGVYDNTERRLLPGMFAHARLHVGDRTAVLLPASAIAKRGTNAHAFVLKNGRLEERVLETDAALDGDVAVIAGIRPGERVVARVTPELADGLRAE